MSSGLIYIPGVLRLHRELIDLPRVHPYVASTHPYESEADFIIDALRKPSPLPGQRIFPLFSSTRAWDPRIGEIREPLALVHEAIDFG